MKRLITLLVVICVLSCDQEKIAYEYLVFRDNNIKMWPDTIPAKLKNTIENGNLTVNAADGSVIAKGMLSQGLRVGEWIYYPTDQKTLTINWQIFENDTVSINYPEGWTIHEDQERSFQATFPLDSGESAKGKYFVILNQNKDSVQMSLKTYSEHYNSVVFATEKINEYALFEILTTENRSFYFSRYVLERSGEEILIFSFLGVQGDMIYDITYSSRNQNVDKKHIVFFDMLRSILLKKQRFFSPFDPVKMFKQYKYPNASQIIS